ncbi:hypothetical protein V6N13_005700 [Hibiscus sabdariffa]|uniref:Uncharacterized protein n=1 Tax=Hibiscus sabdariffa TaxID=183260 RepID=A0ABR2ETY3_9ROSI
MTKERTPLLAQNRLKISNSPSSRSECESPRFEYRHGGMEAKPVEHRQVLGQFPVYDEPSSVVSPQQLHSYQLQLAQPNLSRFECLALLLQL